MRTAVILLATGILAGPVFAESQALAFGLKGGLNYANLNVEHGTMDDSDYLLAYGAGVTIATPVSPSLGIDLDILYMRKGAQEDYRIGADAEHNVLTIKTKMDFVVLSPMLRWSPGRSGAGVYFLGGPEVGYLIKATSSSERDGESDYDTGIEDNYKKIDFGLTAGMGFSTASGKGPAFFVEGRYAIGFSDLVDPDYAEELGYTPTIKTRGIYLFGGLRF